ncbi:MAG: glycosyltransferase family 2 protein [Planctomycetota bacterium]|jgi:GT2 family glycosyltransferase
MRISAVISTWNKREAVLANIAALKAGTRVPDEIVVVDNCSSDGTGEAVSKNYPDVVLVVMPHDKLGACETFNIGFERASGDLIAIMDDDVEATPEWLATLEDTLLSDPESTVMVSSRVIEPGMPEAYQRAEVERGRYYASTFRGCGTLVRTQALREAGAYDVRFFIYGNERDLAARLLARGGRIVQTPDAVIHHSTPFGMKAGKRSLYYHVRNFWLYAFKNCRWSDVFRAAWGMAKKGLGGGGTKVKEDATGSEAEKELEATGTMGLSQAMKETPGAWWIVFKATFNALLNLPYCLSRRAVVNAPDFKLPGM